MPSTSHPTTVPPDHATWGQHYAACAARAPGPVTAIRVLVGLQVGVLLVGVVLGLGFAGLSAFSLDDGGETADWAAGFVTIGLLLAAVCGGAALVLGIPALLVRATGGRPAVVALVFLAALEATTTVVAGVGLVQLVGGSGGSTAVFPALLITPNVAVAVLAMQRSTRDWITRSWRGHR